MDTHVEEEGEETTTHTQHMRSHICHMIVSAMVSASCVYTCCLTHDGDVVRAYTYVCSAPHSANMGGMWSGWKYGSDATTGVDATHDIQAHMEYINTGNMSHTHAVHTESQPDTLLSIP